MNNAPAPTHSSSNDATVVADHDCDQALPNVPDQHCAAAVPDLSSHDLGRRGEAAAARYLERKGMEILERNWSCFAGEADIIARDEETLCFVEVKTRRGIEKGFPEEAITPEKRSRYEKKAACYLQHCDLVDIRIRFDVISLLVVSSSRAFLRYHINAFGGE